jgi:hypothetical protein
VSSSLIKNPETSTYICTLTSLIHVVFIQLPTQRHAVFIQHWPGDMLSSPIINLEPCCLHPTLAWRHVVFIQPPTQRHVVFIQHWPGDMLSSPIINLEPCCLHPTLPGDMLSSPIINPEPCCLHPCLETCCRHSTPTQRCLQERYYIVFIQP